MLIWRNTQYIQGWAGTAFCLLCCQHLFEFLGFPRLGSLGFPPSVWSSWAPWAPNTINICWPPKMSSHCFCQNQWPDPTEPHWATPGKPFFVTFPTERVRKRPKEWRVKTTASVQLSRYTWSLTAVLGFSYWRHQLVSTLYFHQSEPYQQGLQVWSSTRVFNYGHQLLVKDLQLGSSTRIIK